MPRRNIIELVTKTIVCRSVYPTKFHQKMLARSSILQTIALSFCPPSLTFLPLLLTTRFWVWKIRNQILESCQPADLRCELSSLSLRLRGHRPSGFVSGFEAVGIRNTVQNTQRRCNGREQSRADLYLQLHHFKTDHRAAVWGQESDWK